MILTEKQKDLVTDLQNQEELCIQKYDFYEKSARDTALKELFGSIKAEEQQHYNSLSSLLKGTVPDVTSDDQAGANYQPKASYNALSKSEDKEYDQYLCTDCITTEKYTSSAYDNDLFQFGEPNVRRLLNDIQTEEQNHAEKIYKYKSINGMK